MSGAQVCHGFGNLFDEVIEAMACGCAMLDRDFLADLLELSAREHFVGIGTRVVFETIRDLDKEGTRPDLVSVRTRLLATNKLGEIGGDAFLSKCLTLDAISKADPSRLITILRGYAAKRAATKAISDATVALASAPVEVIDNAIADLQIAISEIGEVDRSTAFDAKTLCAQIIHHATEAAAGNSEAELIKTGIAGLDQITGGIERQQLVVIAARPSHGKTAFGSTVAYNFVREGMRVAVFSIEVRAIKFARSMVAKASGIDTRKIQNGSMIPDEWTRLQDTLAEFEKFDLIIDEQPSISAPMIRARVKRLSAKKHVDLVVVDYLQLIEPGDAETRERQVADMSKAMKTISRELDTRVMLLAQLNRKVEDRTDQMPTLSDIRESGAVEQDADQVWMIHYPHKRDANKPKDRTWVAIEKNRDGPRGKVELAFDPATQHVTDIYRSPISNFEDDAGFRNPFK
jgi:replicative DNA helicase